MTATPSTPSTPLTTAGGILIDGLTRSRDGAREAVDGLTPAQLAHRVDTEANTIAWLVWHSARVQDSHVAEADGSEQLWLADGWVDRFGFDLERDDTGYGHTPEQVAAVSVDSPELLVEYFDAVHQRTVAYVATLDDDAVAAIVDERWTPPVTLAVRLVSVIDDCAQHIGQAAFVRGLIERAG
ncbi:mycothiol transferase [Marisediminicola senii]|uniref:mycothiol transferase n=1 Tax=Marisediminicola senii TaxID=2711233 RepID=UPI0013EB5A7F|nr:DUF664 domain-containing protein [Marisediminicola senii]